MALFCFNKKRFSFSLEKLNLLFPFFSSIRVFSSNILLVCRSKYPYSCFFFNFCFLVIVVLLVLVLFVLLPVITPYNFFTLEQVFSFR